MKEIMLAIVAVLICSTALAGIVEFPDKFEGTNLICSQAIDFEAKFPNMGANKRIPPEHLFGNLAGFLLVKFCYSTKNGIPVVDVYGLELCRDEKEIRLATYAEFNFNDNDISPMDRIKANNSRAGTFNLPMILVRQIREAKTLAIRVHYYDKSPITWEVPEALLNEWQS